MDGSIIQVLEGEKERVVSLYNTIANDSRRTGIIKVVEGTASQRNFPDWSMGFRSVNPEEFEQITGYKNIRNEAFLSYPSGDNSHPALIILESFYRTNQL